jgi:hypothetical protein
MDALIEGYRLRQTSRERFRINANGQTSTFPFDSDRLLARHLRPTRGLPAPFPAALLAPGQALPFSD